MLQDVEKLKCRIAQVPLYIHSFSTMEYNPSLAVPDKSNTQPALKAEMNERLLYSKCHDPCAPKVQLAAVSTEQ
jgi:hypothetical protein